MSKYVLATYLRKGGKEGRKGDRKEGRKGGKEGREGDRKWDQMR